MQQDVYGDPMSSHIRQLLDEISWEGNARKYRDGGIGLENVVTTEVFQALDLLPRQPFLAPVLRGLQGGSPGQSSTMAEEAEALTVSTLPGDLTTNCGRVRVSPTHYWPPTSSTCSSKPKHPQPEQLSRRTNSPRRSSPRATMRLAGAPSSSWSSGLPRPSSSEVTAGSPSTTPSNWERQPSPPLA